jgi:hypothetical protein
VSKKIVGIKFREDHIMKMIDVAPGLHDVRVEMRWEDTRRTGSLRLDVADGATGLLEARLVGMAKTLILEWSRLAPEAAGGR